MTPVIWNFRSLANRHHQQQRGPSGNSQLPPGKWCISVLASERDFSQGLSSVASTIQGHNSTASFLLKNSCVADITQRVTSTPCSTLPWSINSPIATLGTCSCSTPAPGGTTPTDSTCHVESSPASTIASTPTPLSGLVNLPSPFPNPEACVIITNQLQTQATVQSQRQRQWQLQPPAVYTPRSVVSGSHSTHRSSHTDITRRVFATCRLPEHHMWIRRPFMSVSDLETVSYAMWCVAKALAEAPHWQIIEMYWNTAMQPNITCSIAFEARTNEIVNEVCWSNSPHWILHAQTSTRYEHKSIRVNPNIFIQHGTT